MAISVTDIYARHHEDHDLDFTKLEQQGDRDPLNLHGSAHDAQPWKIPRKSTT